MFRSIIRSYITALFLIFKNRTDITRKVSSRIYEQSWIIPASAEQYSIRVTETQYRLRHRWGIVPVERKIYRADLVFTPVDRPEVTFTDHYPELTYWGAFLISLGILDPLYPMSLIATEHFDNFLKMEQ